MNRIREILVNQHIGAIAIGFLLALGISNIVTTVVQCAASYWEIQHLPASHAYSTPYYPWSNFVATFIAIFLYLLAALLLMRWLYTPRSNSTLPESGTEAIEP